MIWVLSKEESVLCVLENDNSNACPYKDDLHHEKLNDSYSTYPFSVPLFHKDTKHLVKENKVVIRDTDGNFLMFTIKNTEIDTYSNLKHIHSLNSGLELLGKRIMPQAIQATDVNNILDQYLDGTRWKRGRTDWAGTRTVEIEQVQTAIKAIHDLRSLFDLELQYRVELKNGKISDRYVDLVERIGNDTGKRIENAKDLQEIRIKENSNDLYTALIGIGPQQEDGTPMTFANVEWKKSNGDPLDKPLGQAWLGDPEALEKWGIDGVHITGEFVYSGNSDITPTKLLELTYQQLKKSVEPAETFEIKFADLEKVVSGDGEDYSHEKVRKGDTVTVYHYKIDDSTAIQARVIDLKRSQSNPLAGELVLGDYKRIAFKKSPVIESIQKRLLNYETVLGAQQKAEQAKTSAINTASTDATSKANTAETNAKKYTNDQLGNYVQSVTYNQDLSSIQSQIDGNITSWFYSYAPTLTNQPATSWTTNDTKNNHLGDIFYNTSNGYAYRFALVNGVYSWLLLKDSDLQKALSDAAKAQDTADAKRRTFVNQPVPPYDSGDLWVQGTNGEIMRCQTTKASGQSFSQSDWIKASKYTDDTRAVAAEENAIRVTTETGSMNSNPIFNDWTTTYPDKYTNVGTGPSKVTSDNNTGNSLKYSLSSGQHAWLYQDIDNKAHSEYLTLEVTFKLESGSINGSGILIYHYDNTGSNKKSVLVPLNSLVSNPEIGKWYTVTTVLKGIKSIVNFYRYRIHIMGNWSSFDSSQPAKILYYDSVKVRPSTTEEMYSYENNTIVTSWRYSNTTKFNGGEIQDKTITANHMNVNELSAIVAKLGEVNAGEITGSSFTTSGTEGTVDIRNDYVHSVKTLTGSTDKTMSRLTSGIVSVKETSSDYALLRSAAYLRSQQLELQGLYNTYTQYKKNGFNGVARNETTLTDHSFSFEFDPYAQGFDLTASNGLALNNQARLTSDNSHFRLLSPNGGSNQVRFASNGEFALYQNGAYRHLFKPDGSKIGGSIEIEERVWGMSPIDSPQVKISLLMTDVEIPEGIETIIAYEEKFYKATSNIAIFPSNPNVEVINKSDGSFTVISSKACIVDFFIIGERAGYEGTYFTDMELVYGNTDDELIA